VSKDITHSGDVIQYFITLEISYNPAHNVTVTDVLPTGVTYAGPLVGYPAGTESGGVITWTFDTLAPGTYTLGYGVRVNDFLANGTVLTNEAGITHSRLPVPITASASATVVGDYTVRVGVYNSAGELVREILVSDFSQPVDSVDIMTDSVIDSYGDIVTFYYKGVPFGSWDGTTTGGTPVVNGEYTVKIDNIDDYGMVSSVTDDVTVNRPTSLVQITIYNSAGEAVRHLTAETSGPRDLVTSVTLSTTTIQPSYGPPKPGSVPEVGIVLSDGTTKTWDGRNDDGAIVTTGQYFVEVKCEDGKGGETVVTREISVMADSTDSGEVVAGPNPVLEGEAGTKFMVRGGSSNTLRASIYNVAGELVRKVEGASGAGEVWWGTEGVASGLYIAVVEVIRPGRGVIDRKIKKVMVMRTPRHE